jgi:hypothetical protein
LLTTVSWDNVPAWSTEHEQGVNQRTPDISSIIQLIVNKSGWSSGNSPAIIIDGTAASEREAESYEGADAHADLTLAPYIHIEYSVVATTTTLGDGSDPANSTVAPGSTNQYLDQFTFVTSTGSDSVTALTVTTANTAAVAEMQIWDDTFTTQYFSTVSAPAGNDWSFSGGTSIPVGTSSASFRVRFTAKDGRHAIFAVDCGGPQVL